MTVASSPELLRCEAEPVHLPGAIQPHGVLIALDPADLTIVGMSKNAEAILGLPPEQALGSAITSILGSTMPSLAEDLSRPQLEERNPFLVSLASGETFAAIAHRYQDRIILECEPEDPAGTFDQTHFYNRVRSSLVRLRATSGLDQLCTEAARELRALTGIDRVLVYAFRPDWSGEVVAEDCVGGEPAYLGLRFPASDIPEQARALYASCRLRMVPTATYIPAEVVVLAGQPPLDLTHAVLRSISPVHLEYMRNMGVTASMGISLMRDDRLWGLITCNHESGALRIPYGVRAACALVGELVSSLIEPRERMVAAEQRLALQHIQAELVQLVIQDRDVVRGLTKHSTSLLDLTRSTGAALSYGGALHLLGATPPEPAIAQLLAWLEEQGTGAIVAESLPALYPAAHAWKDVGCGLIARSVVFADLSVVSHPCWLLWFRPEVTQNVSWGGDPNKAVARGEQRLSPRTSFEHWKEDVHLQSAPFLGSEIAAAASLATAIADMAIAIEAARKIRSTALALEQTHRELLEQIAMKERVEVELRRAQKLEAIGRLAAGVAHEINTPLQFVNGNIHFLQGSTAGLLKLAAPHAGAGDDFEYVASEMPKAFADSLDGLARVSVIVRALTAFAHPDVEKSVGDINQAISVTVQIARGETKDVADVELELGQLPEIPCFIGDLNQVFLNLIVNAAHAIAGTLGEARTRGVITIKSWLDGPDVVVTVADDGVGIPEANRESVFLPFFTTKEVGRGTGQGLALCHAVVVDKHGGSLTFESEVGRGTTFRVRLPSR